MRVRGDHVHLVASQQNPGREVREQTPTATRQPPTDRRQEEAVEARSLDAAVEALGALSTSDAAPDKHPEK